MIDTPKMVIFSDFDGTISTRDVGNRLFHHFSNGRSEEIVSRWKAGEIDARRCLSGEAELIRLTHEKLAEYLDSFSLDPGFDRFVSLCRVNGIETRILSDGLDLYINYLLTRFGYDYLPVLANRGEIVGDRLEVSYPFAMGECGVCGNCKGDRIREYVGGMNPRPLVIFIGDGLSDRCATGAADWIFAKNELADYCATNLIEFNSFDTFEDITRLLAARGRFGKVTA